MTTQNGESRGPEAHRAPGRPARRLRRRTGGRHHIIGVRVSEEEWAVVKARADQLGISVARLSFEAIMSPVGTVVAETRYDCQEWLAIRRLTGAVGNNLNQIAKVLNSTGQLPTGSALDATLVAIARILARQDAALTAMVNLRDQK